MSGWWRTNAVALASLVVLVPATAFTVSALEASSHETAVTGDPITVDPGDTIEYAGATLGPASAEFTPSDLAPRGTRVVIVTIPVSDSGSMGCIAPVLREVDGDHRQWSDDTIALGLGGDGQTSCSSDESARYTLELAYLVPSDARGPFGVDVLSGEALPDLARFIVEP